MKSLLSLLELVADMPAIQGPIADAVVGAIKSKADSGVQKAVKDFLTAIASKL